MSFDGNMPETWGEMPEYYRNALSMLGTHPSDMETRAWKQKMEEEWQAKEICGQIPPRKRKKRNPLKDDSVLNAEATEFRKTFLDWANGMPFEIEIRYGYKGIVLDYFVLHFGERWVDVKTGDWLFSVTYWENGKTRAVNYESFDHREVGMEMPDAQWYQSTFQKISDFLTGKINLFR